MHFCFLKFLVDGELRFKKKKKLMYWMINSVENLGQNLNKN